MFKRRSALRSVQGLKQAVLADGPLDTPIVGPDGKAHVLQALMPCLEITPGLRIAYITDVVHIEANAQRIQELAKDADWLFIECVLLDEQAERARDKKHLTAAQAGRLARAAGVRNVVPFHFSPIYREREAELRAELEQAWRG